MSVSVNAVVYSRVVDPLKAILEVEDYRYATSELSQTTLRSVLGQAELDELLADREHLNQRLRETIDSQSDPWGIKIIMVEVKHVDLPDAMKRSMAQQAESRPGSRATSTSHVAPRSTPSATLPNQTRASPVRPRSAASRAPRWEGAWARCVRASQRRSAPT